MTREAASKLIDRKDLTYDEVRAVMDEIMSSGTSPVQTATFLAVLFAKDETIEGITTCVIGMRARVLPVEYTDDLLEVAGTGKDGLSSFNISTVSSVVIATDGVQVTKRGNRAASSHSGAADCLEVLGVSISLSPEQYVSLLQNVGICFLFAQTYHSSIKYVGPVRKELDIRTIFNILGPLTNPTHANLQMLGVYSEEMVEPLVHMLHNLGVQRGMVVYEQSKLDEISLSSPTTVCEFNGDEFTAYVIRPQDFGLTPYEESELAGGTPRESAQITLGILNGIESVKRGAVLLNAGAGLYVTGKAASLETGVRLAAELIDSGRAMAKLQEFILGPNWKEEAAS